jgi:membrane protein YqaA with SNARE-associated domain
MALRRLLWRYLLVAIVAVVLGGFVGFGVARLTVG